MPKDRSDGDFDIVFKHVALPQFSKGKILTPVCYRQGFIAFLVGKNMTNWRTNAPEDASPPGRMIPKFKIANKKSLAKITKILLVIL